MAVSLLLPQRCAVCTRPGAPLCDPCGTALHPLSPLTTTLTYGVIGPDGSCDVRLVYDHRVLDGAVVARALARLEEELTGPVCDELRAMAPDRSRDPRNAAA